MICILSLLYTITIVYNQDSDKLINILMITGLIVNSVKQPAEPLFGSPPFGPAKIMPPLQTGCRLQRKHLMLTEKDRNLSPFNT